MISSNLSLEEARKTFKYKNGCLYWKISPNQKIKIGSKVGGKNNRGYYQLQFKRKNYKRSRFIFFIKKGYWAKEIDHINRKKRDDRIENLRDATRSENNRNRRAYGEVREKYITKQKNSQFYKVQIERSKKERNYLGIYRTIYEALIIRDLFLLFIGTKTSAFS